MAFNERRIFPNDQRPSVAIGFNLPMNEGGVFTPNFQTKDAIKNNLINYFLTNPGERPGNPLFGAGLRNFIFTQIDEQDFSFIEDDIQTKINEFVSKVPADELAAFFEECHIFGDSRLYRWDPVFRTYERRDF